MSNRIKVIFGTPTTGKTSLIKKSVSSDVVHEIESLKDSNEHKYVICDTDRLFSKDNNDLKAREQEMFQNINLLIADRNIDELVVFTNAMNVFRFLTEKKKAEGTMFVRLDFKEMLQLMEKRGSTVDTELKDNLGKWFYSDFFFNSLLKLTVVKGIIFLGLGQFMGDSVKLENSGDYYEVGLHSLEVF